MVKIRRVPDFPGYGMSTDGRVWSKRLKGRKKDGEDRIGGRWRELRQGTMDRGYKTVSLCIDQKYTRFLVHRLMLLVFVGPPPVNFPEACHENDIKDDNRLENLYWGTRQSNMEDAIRNGRTTKGEDNAQSKLTWKKVREIRKRWSTSRVSQDALAEEYGVSQSAISLVVLNKAWVEV